MNKEYGADYHFKVKVLFPSVLSTSDETGVSSARNNVVK